MLRFTPIENARQAESYYAKSDGGYYLRDRELGCEWLGKGAAMLGLAGRPDYEQFKRLIHGLEPHSGEQLTAKLIDDRIPGWDVTASVPKGVTVALESGDARIQELLRSALTRAFEDLEEYATTRVRKGRREADRRTGNLVAYAVEHPETRPTKEDGMPDWDRHWHIVIFNLTHDGVENEWKAVKFRPIMDLRKYFSHRFDMYLARGLVGLGYEVETKYRSDGTGGKRYYSWDIKGVPTSVVKKSSRRAAEVETLAAELGIDDAVRKDKLGATSRMLKRDDMSLEDYRAYWNTRITEGERAQVAETIERAKQGMNSKPERSAADGMEYAIADHFFRNSVEDWHKLAVTAMERSMGRALPSDIEPEAKRQGVLFKDGQVTTRDVLAEEKRILAFARDGKGTLAPMGAPAKIGSLDLGKLSGEQQAMCRHIWQSADRVILARGGAGTGKTSAMKPAIAGIEKPVVVLAPSADASRGQLRKEGFQDAETVAAFLGRRDRQERARNGVIWIDEAAMLGVADLRRVVDVAEQVNARLVLQGDPRQHKSPARHGNMFEVLQKFAGLPMAELKDIKRQEGDYKAAVDAFQQGHGAKGLAILDRLGWIRHVATGDVCKAVADKWWENMTNGRPSVISGITHKQNEAITAELRARLREAGRIGKEEWQVEQLKPLQWTDAQKMDFASGQYDGGEVIQFVRKNGRFRAGDRVSAQEVAACKSKVKPENFAVYAPATIGLSKNDAIRITAGGKTIEGHRLDNGQSYTFLGMTKEGDLKVSSGRATYTIGKDFKHIAHGLVKTSHKVQGQTDPTVISVMTRQTLPAISAEQSYVDLSRGRKEATIVTDLSPAELREAIGKRDVRRSATELMARRHRARITHRARTFLRNVRHTYTRLRERAAQAIKNRTIAPERGLAHER